MIFTDEDSVEVVPTTWISNNKCYWPSLTTEKLKAAVKRHDPPNTSWPLYSVRLIRNGTFANYSTAEEKCKKAEYSSDINSDRSLENKRKVIKRTFGSSFEEGDLSSDDNNNLPTKLPAPPRLTNGTSTFISKTKLQKKSEATNNDRIRNEEFERNLSQLTDNNDPLNSNDGSFIEPLNVSECKCCPVHIEHKCEKYFREIIRQQSLLKANMSQYRDSLQELTTSINRITNDKTHQVEETNSFFTMFNFPVQNEEDLICVNEYLNDEKNFNVAMNEFSKIGGRSVQNFTQRALKMVITNDLAATYSWLGRRTKKTFNNLKLADLIIGSVKRSIPNSTNKECEEAIQKWLKRAKERANSQKYKEIIDIKQNNI